MKYPTKVTVEVTADSYTTTVLAGKKVIAKKTHKMLSRGSAKGIENGEFYDDLPDDEDLAEAVDDIHSNAFSVAGELWGCREDGSAF